MLQTTLCYLFQEDNCLLLHRNKKKEDQNQGKWVGIGGKLEENESPHEGILREFQEETGLTLVDYRYRGHITFCSDCWEGEFIHLFSAHKATGQLGPCDEGTLAWQPISDLFTLPRWEGDDIFLKRLLQETPFFSLKLSYQGDNLIQAKEDNQLLSLHKGSSKEAL